MERMANCIRAMYTRVRNKKVSTKKSKTKK